MMIERDGDLADDAHAPERAPASESAEIDIDAATETREAGDHPADDAETVPTHDDLDDDLLDLLRDLLEDALEGDGENADNPEEQDSSEEVRDALRELTQAMTKLERTVRASRRNPQRRPFRTEVGFIDIASTEVESTVMVTKTNWRGATHEEEEVVKTRMNQFVAYALGPNGRYVAGQSRTWKPIGGGERGSSAELGRILDEFLAILMEEGWAITPPGSRYDGHYRNWMRDGKVHWYLSYSTYGSLSLRRAVTD